MVCVQEEFKRLSTQLELLRDHNMRHGNRHLAAKISAMQEAAKEYKEKIPEEDSDQLVVPTIPTTTTTVVSKSPPPPTNHTKRTDKCGDKCSKTERKSRESPHHQPGVESNQNNQSNQSNQLRSGHARTHKIVINLDDKNRFTEEVTV